LAKVTSKNKDYKKQIQKTKLKLKNNTVMYNVSLQIWLTAHLVPHFHNKNNNNNNNKNKV